MERYGALMEGLCAVVPEVRLEIPVTYQDGRKGMLAATVALHEVAAPVPARRDPITERA